MKCGRRGRNVERFLPRTVARDQISGCVRLAVVGRQFGNGRRGSLVGVLGLPIDYTVLATSLYRSISSRQAGVAAVLAGAIMLIGVISLLIDARLVRESRKFVTVGVKGAMNRPSALGAFRLPACCSLTASPWGRHTDSAD